MERFIRAGNILFKTALAANALVILFFIGLLNFESMGFLDDWLVIDWVILFIIFLPFLFSLLLALFIVASFFIVLREKRKAQSIGGGQIAKSDVILLLFSAAVVIGETILGVLLLLQPQSPLTFSCDVVAFRFLTLLEKTENALYFFDLQLITSMFVGVVLILSVISALRLFLQIRSGKTKSVLMAKLIVLVFGMLVIVSTIILAYSVSLNSVRGTSRDARRIADIKQVQLALELYRDDNQERYPVVSGETSQERWNNLRLILPPTWIPALPDDPCYTQAKEHQYDYKVALDGESYVMRAILGNPYNPVLQNNNDTDGEVIGVWCGAENKELEYCVRSW